MNRYPNESCAAGSEVATRLGTEGRDRILVGGRFCGGLTFGRLASLGSRVAYGIRATRLATTFECTVFTERPEAV
jgi:hypothetical protein